MLVYLLCMLLYFLMPGNSLHFFPDHSYVINACSMHASTSCDPGYMYVHCTCLYSAGLESRLVINMSLHACLGGREPWES